MNNAPTLPTITDEDIAWVSNLMRLTELDEPRLDFLRSILPIDVTACPGSGKTTLVVAKLAMLSRKWSHSTSGICVLSHTNVARQEIQDKLGATSVGAAVLAYPHFIDTIHTFANRFLAMPYLHSNGKRSVIVDDNVANNFRKRSVSIRDFRALQSFLSHKHASIEDITFAAPDLKVMLGESHFPASSSSKSFQVAQAMLANSVDAGIFKFEEMFVWALAYLEQHPSIAAALSHRFPVVMVDEMQDTSDKQLAVLKSVFGQPNNQAIIQRIGDPNQGIFQSSTEENNPDRYPISGRTLEIPSSRRFGQTIAELANPFAEREITGGLQGTGPSVLPDVVNNACSPLIIVFPDNDTSTVIPTYGTYLMDHFPDEILSNVQITALGAVHRKPAPQVAPGHRQFPKSVTNYWPAYEAEATSSVHPRCFIDYVRTAQETANGRGNLHDAVEIVATGLIRAAKMTMVDPLNKTRARSHRLVKRLLSENPELATMYDEFVYRCLVVRQEITSDWWADQLEKLNRFISALACFNVLSDQSEEFIQWAAPSEEYAARAKDQMNASNICTVKQDSRAIDIQLNSIHGAKGQTHFSTLVLSTFYRSHSSSALMGWLCGERMNKGDASDELTMRLRQSFVALTRPTHVIAVAVRYSALGNSEKKRGEQISQLQHHGWRVITPS